MADKDSTIELAQNWDAGRACYPMLHQQKHDGVPGLFYKKSGIVFALTRQREVIHSCAHIKTFCHVLLKEGEGLVAELVLPGKPFKESSGAVRKKIVNTAIKGWVFDFYSPEAIYYDDRMSLLRDRLIEIESRFNVDRETFNLVQVAGTLVYDANGALAAHEALMQANPDAEGSMFHQVSKPWQPGTRRYDLMRLKPTPTIDLRVIGFEEAKDKNGMPMGMVGGVLAEFNTYRNGSLNMQTIGIGPGKLTHSQRKMLWKQQCHGLFKPRIAEIKYMRDDTYDALRQPTFQCWRDDKDEPDVLR
jgi:ATP-dependent DNA ligase